MPELRKRTGERDLHDGPRMGAGGAAFGRTTTEKRFIAAFGTVVLVLGVGAYTTLTGLEELHSMMHESVSAAKSLTTAHELERGLLSLHAEQTYAESTSDGPAGAGTERALRAIDKAMRSARSSMPEQGQSLLLAEVARLRKQLAMAPESSSGAGTISRHRQRIELLREFERTIDRYTRTVSTRLESFEDHASAVAHSGFRNALILLAGASVLTLVIGLALGRSVARPLAILHTGARQIADGDLTTRIDLEGPREFRELAAQLNDMVVATRENQERLVESERLAGVGRLAAGIAHEINNPLGVIRGYVKLANQRTDDPDLAADLKVIEDECVRCHEIVQGLLDLSRPAVDSAAEVPLRGLVEQLVDRLAGAEESRASRATIVGDGTAWGNSRTIRQVLINLLDNAFFATDPAGVVRVSISTPDTGAVTVDVCDDGPGLPSQEEHSIFEPFFTTKSSGTGLGLAVSRAIARAHGGELTAHDAEGGGALFRLTLPSPPEKS